MAERLQITFVPTTAPYEGPVCLLSGQDLVLGPVARDLNQRSGGALLAAAEAAGFKGKLKSSIELLAPAKLGIGRLHLVGAGQPAELSEHDLLVVGGLALGCLAGRRATAASLIADLPDLAGVSAAEAAAELALGALLRSYRFTKYQTRQDEEANGEGNGAAGAGSLERLAIHVDDAAAADAAFAPRRAVANGVLLARDLVNEPANVLGPVEFAERTRDLARVGVEVEVLDVDAMKALKMDALLGVGQGSVRPSRLVVMQWHGARSKRAKPVCFVGKGVCFDTGGISIKPASGMEDMKGDMGGAACVTGLMHALAERKAHVNAVGLIGLVENMPSGSAQRPGDIVRSMSRQTIEVINTDAEGRLVLADVLWYAQDRFKPKLIVDLATLTGAIMVALGKEYAGLFSNDDKLAADLAEAGEATGEKVWRMPLAKPYDKLIDSKIADMKNVGGRNAGAITAAQFLHRFIRSTPWAHIDVAGVAMDSNKTEINQGWASGWGVRLLDRMIADKLEKA